MTTILVILSVLLVACALGVGVLLRALKIRDELIAENRIDIHDLQKIIVNERREHKLQTQLFKRDLHSAHANIEMLVMDHTLTQPIARRLYVA